MKVDKIHVWQFPLTKVSVKLNTKTKNLLFERALEHFNNFVDLTSFLSRKSAKYEKGVTKALIQYYYHKAKFIPLWVIYELAKALRINLSYIEKSIVGYLSFRGRIVISRPKLPILVTPEFTAIVIHMMGDGGICQGRFFYFQKVKENQDRFYNKIKNIFGEYEVNQKKGHYAPKIVADVISKYFSVPDYSTFGCRIPSKVYNQSKLHKVAVLSAHLADEGTVSGDISFSSSNRDFLNDVRNIAIQLGYKCSNILSQKQRANSTSKHDAYWFSIRIESIYKIFKDLEKLIENYPDCNPGYKFEEIKRMVKIRARSWKQRRKGETKQLILDTLNSGSKTAFELRDIINVSLWTIYHHLQQLIKKNKVKKSGANYENRVLYSLNT